MQKLKNAEIGKLILLRAARLRRDKGEVKVKSGREMGKFRNPKINIFVIMHLSRKLNHCFSRKMKEQGGRILKAHSVIFS